MKDHSQRQESASIVQSARWLLMGTAASLTISGFAAPAFAQDEVDEKDNAIIIVNARKQDETLQETPVTVTSISADTLDKFQVNEVADVVSRIPALNVQVGGSGAGGQDQLARYRHDEYFGGF